MTSLRYAAMVRQRKGWALFGVGFFLDVVGFVLGVFYGYIFGLPTGFTGSVATVGLARFVSTALLVAGAALIIAGLLLTRPLKRSSEESSPPKN